jgi:hypothetical protein
MNKRDLPPSAIVLDVVVEWSNRIGVPGTAHLTRDGALVIATFNHRDEYLMFSVPMSFDGVPSDGTEGAPLCFRLQRLGPGVWKLRPSVKTDRIHAYVDIVGVPEPPPWETAP